MSTPLTRGLSLVLSLSLGVGFGWAESVRVAGNAVKLRQGPGATTPVTATLVRGDVLDVLERSGDWYRVRTRSGVTGYVSARWVEPWTAPAQPKAEPSPAVAAPAPRAEASAGAVGVAHKDVGCVVAGRHPRFDACFTPAEAVGRAQVQFRADENGPWFSVDMKGDGSCHSALLPKPTNKIERFHYFIEVVDRSFAMVLQPGSAPDRSYAPRVVSRESDCGQGLLVAASNPTASVVVNMARDAGGKVLQAGTASAGGTPASLSGFSMDGVTLPGNAGGSGAAVTAAAGGGIGLGVVAIGAGVLAAGAAVAVVAGGGSSDSASGGGDGTASLTGAGPAPPPTAEGRPMSGRFRERARAPSCPTSRSTSCSRERPSAGQAPARGGRSTAPSPSRPASSTPSAPPVQVH